jgi:hypothetical protein
MARGQGGGSSAAKFAGWVVNGSASWLSPAPSLEARVASRRSTER